MELHRKVDINRSVNEKRPYSPAPEIITTACTAADSKPALAGPAWIFTVALGSGFAFVVLAVNVGAIIWIHVRFKVVKNIAVVFTGQCAQTSATISYVELLVNIFATGILAVSNNCAQLLASPTRAEVDTAHANGNWMNIGSPSISNIRWISKWRKVLLLILFLSSVPIYLLYNSVIYSSSHQNDYLALAVTAGFIQGGFWNETLALQTIPSSTFATSQQILNRITSMQNSVRSLKRLKNDECRSAFGSRDLSSPYISVILVTNSTAQDSFLSGIVGARGTNTQPWFSQNEISISPISNLSFGQPSPCESYNYGGGSNWSIPMCNCGTQGDICDTPPAFVSYCLAEPANNVANQCTISVNRTLLIIIIILNSITFTCIGATLLAWNFRPLATMGDAISSFLNQPDSATVGFGSLSLSTLSQQIGKEDLDEMTKAHEEELPPWAGKKYRWVHVVGSPSYIFMLCMCFVAWLIFLVLASRSWEGSLLSDRGRQIASSTLSSLAPSFAANVLLVNAPQLLVSFMYLFLNFMITRMVTAHDLTKFASRRRPLRVSQRVGVQRSTYWLQLPYRYTIPMISSAIVLRWQVSCGFFLVNIQTYDISGQEVPALQRFGYSTSGLPLLFAFILGMMMLCTFVGLMFRRLEEGMPVMGTCSIAISAACHPAEGDEDAAMKPLMYGVSGDMEDKLGREHVCFSSMGAAPLMHGSSYF